MANRESNLDLISVNQAQKEVTANELFNAASPAMLYGRRASLSTGLTFGYYGGNIVTSSGSVVAVENGTVELTAESTNYIVAKKSDGTVSVSVSDTNWNSSDYWRLYLCEAGAATVTDYQDYRVIGDMTSAGGGGGAPSGGLEGQVLVKNSDSDGDTTWSYAVGKEALVSLTTGLYNTAYGERALRFNTEGDWNSAFGYNALASNTTGSGNSAFGGGAMAGNEDGYDNCAFGEDALIRNIDGYKNVSIGHQSMSQNTSGIRNVAIGARALAACTTGSDNVAVGLQALEDLTSGNTNIGIYPGGYTPVFAITTESNRLVMGHTSITNAYVQVAWTVVSDARDKTEIQDVTIGSDFVKQLRPVSFRFKKSREDDTPHGSKRYGFLAQDILELEGDNPVIIDNEDEDRLKYNGESLVPVLVKALQEQMTIIEQLRIDIDALKGNS